MQEFSFLGKIALVSGRYWDDIDPNDNSGMQKISRRVISTYIKICLVLQFWTSKVRSVHLHTSPILVFITDI